ncbi:tyrosine-protein phosphatase [Texcoconibacillus texcoconensis]|uniref:Tyrosine-protein phosphatase n=1 Tax=Texcoconibacillus texcoconensis TaxID=1095777 RepID=A0A840QQT3_9BACI|nr:CpsB/CapC family capsule biosynthesis tyrosine phosphatase [Texcoconibacillus texcoconensis]MBB5173806.1 protein-tyrosine phosphatase [Texcoconibacillus texcoconensis]
MIDIHCHILPELDDGAKSLSESIAMAKRAKEQGVEGIVATPHHAEPVFSNTRSTILQKSQRLNRALAKEGIDLTIFPGQEARIHPKLPEAVDNQEALTTNDAYKYMLVELPFHYYPDYTEQVLLHLLDRGVTPVLAHPERNSELVRNPNILYRLVEGGVCTQLTTASVLGYFGEQTKTACEQFIDQGLIHVLASDAHNTNKRPCRWLETKKYIDQTYDQSTWAMFNDNTHRIILGKPLHKRKPREITSTDGIEPFKTSFQ